ncbi:MAG: hypothetical protein ACI9CB_002819 [Rhodothermales bacterium]|jgi:hypothetical protein
MLVQAFILPFSCQTMTIIVTCNRKRIQSTQKRPAIRLICEYQVLKCL